LRDWCLGRAGRWLCWDGHLKAPGAVSAVSLGNDTSTGRFSRKGTWRLSLAWAADWPSVIKAVRGGVKELVAIFATSFLASKRALNHAHEFVLIRGHCARHLMHFHTLFTYS
jgi:hypothetical protein